MHLLTYKHAAMSFEAKCLKSLELYRLLYARYGIAYFNPVFNVNRSDHVLFDRGVAGAMLYGYTPGVGIPMIGRSADRATAETYVKAKIEEERCR